MLIDFIKFIHLLCVMALLGMTFCCLWRPMYRPYKVFGWTSLLAMITGTLLVFPKHYTFHTHWIQAAYLLLAFFAVGTLLLKKTPAPLLRRSIYLVLMVCLVLIVHDAVTKTTFIAF